MADLSFHHRESSRTLTELAKIGAAELNEGVDGDKVIDDVAPLHEATSGQISFLDNVKYKEQFSSTKAGACVVSPKMVELAPKGLDLLLSKNPYKTYALIAQAFYPEVYPESEISASAHIDKTASIADGCIIEPGAVIKAGVTLGKGCWVEANAVIDKNVQLGQKCRIGTNASVSHAILGDNVRLYPGVRVGQDGFGFAIDPAGHVKVPQLGRVLIEDNVEIGANTCIDRGAGPDTIIGAGTWIDNMVQIGHNAKVGRGCVIVGQAGVAGSAVLEDYVVVAAQVGVAGHLTVGMGAQIAAQSGVMRDVPPGEKMMGSPADPIKDHMRQITTLKRLAAKS